MAAENPPYAIQADSHGAELFRLAVASLLPRWVGKRSAGSGGIVNVGDLAITAGSGNTLSCGTGEAWVPGNQGPHQSAYYCFNDATVTGLAVTPNASNPLVVLVTASVNDQAYSGNPGVTNNQWGLLLTQGTPAASPAIPATPANSLVLATVLVPANASSAASYTIVQGLATISGTTLTAPLGQTGPATIGEPAGFIYSSANQSVPYNTVTPVGGSSVGYLRGGMTLSGTSGQTQNQLIVPVPGIYSVAVSVYFSQWLSPGAPIAGVYVVQNSSAVREFITGTAAGSYYTFFGSTRVLCAAGDTIGYEVYHNSSTTQVLNAGVIGTWMAAELVSY